MILFKQDINASTDRRDGPPRQPKIRARAGRVIRSDSGQAAILLVASCLLLFVGVAAFGQYGGAFVRRGQVQSGADLVATAAAKRMSGDYARLMSPPVLPNGMPNPLHLSLANYLARARSAAIRAARANHFRASELKLNFARGPAPTNVTATLHRVHQVQLPAADGRQRKVILRARATAELRFAIASLPQALPTTGSGGGYAGPLAYRQGKPMRPDVAAAFDRMVAAARSDGVALTINSAFRSDSEQARLFAQRPDQKWVAPPGTSLHRYGTELDIGPAASYGWLGAHARSFGFILRYRWEPWHWGFGANPRDVPAQYERGSFEPPSGRFDGRSGVPSWVPARYVSMIASAAQRWNVQPELLAAQLQAESGFNPHAVSPSGAQGIAQFMPATAASIGLRDPFDPAQAIPAQAKLMSGLIRQFGSISLALAAYNAGPGAVQRYGGVPPFAETQAYVARILSLIKGGLTSLSDPALAGIAVQAKVRLVR